MEPEHQIAFGPFRLETTPGRLWRGDQVIPLRPRSLAMLRYLVAHPGRLVTKAEVQQHVWAGTHVSDSVLRVSVKEIRAALGDAAVAPRYLETVGRQGYRFLGGGDREAPPPLHGRPPGGAPGRSRGPGGVVPAGGPRHPPARLRQWGSGRGEDDGGRDSSWPAWPPGAGCGPRGQCVEHYGEGEPYLPFLEALGRLGHGPERDAVRAVLRRYAPMWLAHLPGLVSEPELERLQGRLHGTTPARMLRELAEALEVLTADRALVLVLEDLQWSDHSTVEASPTWRSGPSRRGCWCWGRIGRWRCCSRGIPCAAWSRSCVGGGRGSTCGWSSCPRRTWRRMWRGGWAGRWRPPHGVRLCAHGRQCVVHGEHRGASGAAGAGGAAGGGSGRCGRGRGAGGESAGGVAGVAPAAHRGPPAGGSAGAGGRQCGGRGVCGGGGGGRSPGPHGGRRSAV